MITVEIKNNSKLIGTVAIGPEVSNYLIPYGSADDNDNLYAEFKSPSYAARILQEGRSEDIEYLIEESIHMAFTRHMKKISEYKKDGVQPSDTSCFAPSREPNKPEDSVIALMNQDEEDDLA